MIEYIELCYTFEHRNNIRFLSHVHCLAGVFVSHQSNLIFPLKFKYSDLLLSAKKVKVIRKAE